LEAGDDERDLDAMGGEGEAEFVVLLGALGSKYGFWGELSWDKTDSGELDSSGDSVNVG